MGAARNFAKDPYGFLQSNMLMVTDPDIWYPKQQQLDSRFRAKLTLIDMVEEGYSIRPGPKKRSSFFGLRSTEVASAKGLYRVVMAGPNTPVSDIFLAYICPFKKDAGALSFLGTDADIMVTAEMSGCTFGVGSACPKTGSRMVMHANSWSQATSGDDDGSAPQYAAQDDLVSSGLRGTDAMWRPNQYRKVTDVADVRSTIIGVRGKKPPIWNFYAQTYDAGADDRQLLSITKIA
jgi:hypothetical protein